jgi:hypothetical protein
MDPSTEGRQVQDRSPVDEETQNPMFPDPFDEQSDEQYPFDEEQSDEKSSHGVEMETTQHTCSYFQKCTILCEQDS